MKAVRKEMAATEQLSPETKIWIIGANGLQNYLLGSYLEQRTGVACEYSEKLAVETEGEQCLVLYDCFLEDYENLWIRTELMQSRRNDNIYLAFFNVDPEGRLEQEFVSNGIRGVFYLGEFPENLSKGAEAILRGEFWYSRKATAMLLENTGNSARVIQMAKTGLTPREKQILQTIAAGASNSDIADKYHISHHTVKNHIYNIYRKIKVKSRLDAILWVTKYL